MSFPSISVTYYNLLVSLAVLTWNDHGEKDISKLPLNWSYSY
jgi:hypothetical protein